MIEWIGSGLERAGHLALSVGVGNERVDRIQLEHRVWVLGMKWVRGGLDPEGV
jgi:hypothetical protein